MSGFDTSGAVTLAAAVVIGQGKTSPLTWSDLNPFTQGYVEAVCSEADTMVRTTHHDRRVSFSDLAPETLARIMEDCSRHQQVHEHLLGLSKHPDPKRPGRLFWIMRNQAGSNIYAPLTPYLGDDGRVYLRDAPSPSSDRGGS